MFSPNRTKPSTEELQAAFETIRVGMILTNQPGTSVPVADTDAWEHLDGVAKQLNVSNPYEHKFVNGEVLTIRK